MDILFECSSKGTGTDAYRRETSISDYQLGRTIGKGSFGNVVQCQHIESGSLYAIKCIKKSKVTTKAIFEHLKNEKQVLSTLKSPFTVDFFGSFQDHNNIYFITEYIPGGELFKLLRTHRVLAISSVRFYAAEITSALEYLHSRNIVYRDLKPENVLVSATGHVKLIDFGFATQIKEGETCSSFCGTLEYLAPEIVQRIGHGLAVDWWTLGVLLYELLVGTPPFVGGSTQGLFEKIVKTEVSFPKDLDEEARDLIGKLLTKKPWERISGKDVMGHRFFKDVDWGEVEKKGMVPPWVPVLRDESDTSHFDEYPGSPVNKKQPIGTHSFAGF